MILGILAAVAFPKFQDLSGDAKTAVLNGAKAAILSAAVISFAKNAGVKQTFATITGATGVALDPAVTPSGNCAAVLLTYTGGTTIATFDISEYCSG